MPDVAVGGQISDLCFHPTQSIVYTGLLTGEVKAFRYDEQGQHESIFRVRPSKRPCRGLVTNEDGSKLFAVGKGKAMHTVDTTTGKIVNSRLGLHEAAINRITRCMSNMLATGDDNGVVKLLDTRKPDPIRSYDHHFDFISDFMWISDKRQLVMTSGDGTLSVVDVRSNKTQPLAHSEDQEDELLSIVSIRGGAKAVVGTQLGILSVFNRSSGWGDCVDRVPGHPHSIDALCNLPSSYSSSHSTILTGSSDGLLRAVQLFPTKLIGVVADHGDFPIERIAVGHGGEGRWVGSVGHDEILRMTDLRAVFEDEVTGDGDVEGGGDLEQKEGEGSDDENGIGIGGGNAEESDEDEDDEGENGHRSLGGISPRKEWDGLQEGNSTDALGSINDSDSDSPKQKGKRKLNLTEIQSGAVVKEEEEDGEEGDEKDGADSAAADSDSDDDELKEKKKRKRKEKDPLAAGKKQKQNGEFNKGSDPSFFSGL
ncbi:WD40 repeat-like protein [Rickenella mellea]|uniref:WD repeat-containing protein JIP5 n=1 Tax=Rickenella mellea TaxID=50990 RepID=A0A4Y7PVP5_9AGAM|nr:WD40 repeat-like protein [Rickenella mellea]